MTRRVPTHREANGWLRSLLTAPDLGDEDRTRVARLAHAVQLLALGLLVPFVAFTAVVSPADLSLALTFSAFLAAVVLVSIFLLRRGALTPVGLALTIGLFVAVTLFVADHGIRDLAVTGYFLVIALGALLLGGRAALWFGAACILALAGLYYGETAGLVPANVEPFTSPFQLMVATALLAVTAFLLRFSVRSTTAGFRQARGAARELSEAYAQLAAGREATQAHAAELERRTAYMQASAEVGHAAASILEVDLLAERVVELICSRFGLYYVGLFLLDETGKWAVLRAGTGEAGQAMLARHHRIALGEGMIGWCIAHRQARIALQADRDAVRLVAPELSETRSEAAVPLRSRGQILGAITVQDRQPDTFQPDTLIVLQTMADQVAIALDNARLFAESQAALEAERRAYGEVSRQAWADMVRGRADLGYICSQGGVVRPLSHPSQSLPVEASASPDQVPGGERKGLSPQGQRPAPKGATGQAAALSLPIRIRDHQVGVVRLRKQAGAGDWTAEERTLMQTLTQQLEVALESARLYQDTQHRAVRDRLMAEIGGRVRETLEVDAVLRTAALEIRQALDLPEVVVRLTGQPLPGTPQPAGPGSSAGGGQPPSATLAPARPAGLGGTPRVRPTGSAGVEGQPEDDGHGSAEGTPQGEPL